MARKGQFKKGGGRVGDSTAIVVARRASPRRRASSSPRIITVAASPARRRTSHHITAKAKRRGGRRRGGHHGVTLPKLVIAAGVLQSVAETNTGPAGATVYDLVQKLPGTKTLGGAATAGLYLGALGKFTSLGSRSSVGPWLKAAGAVGIVLATAKVVTQGKAFKWLGDVGHHNDHDDSEIAGGFDSE